MNANDVCDRCSAAAKTRFVKGEQDLLFCGHHAYEYNFSLIAAGFQNETFIEDQELVSA